MKVKFILFYVIWLFTVNCQTQEHFSFDRTKGPAYILRNDIQPFTGRCFGVRATNCSSKYALRDIYLWNTSQAAVMKRNEKHKNREESVSFRVRQDGKYSHIEVACVIRV